MVSSDFIQLQNVLPDLQQRCCTTATIMPASCTWVICAI